METYSEVIFHHLDLSINSVRLLARSSSACDNGAVVSADVYECRGLSANGGCAALGLSKKKEKGNYSCCFVRVGGI